MNNQELRELQDLLANFRIQARWLDRDDGEQVIDLALDLVARAKENNRINGNR